MSKVGIRELASLLAKKRKLEPDVAIRFVTAFFEVLSDGTYNDKAVKVKGLGTFKVISVSARKSVDVNTGESIELSGRDKMTFTPDAGLRDLVNRPFAQFETVVVNDGVDFSEIDARMGLAEEPEETAEEETENAAHKERDDNALPPNIAKVMTDLVNAVSDEKSVREEVWSEAPETEESETAEMDKEEMPVQEEVQAEETPETVAEHQTCDEPEPEKINEISSMKNTIAENTVNKHEEALRMQNEHLAEANELLREQLEHSRKMLHIFGWILGFFVLLCLAGAYLLGTQFALRNALGENRQPKIKVATDTLENKSLQTDSLKIDLEDTDSVGKAVEPVPATPSVPSEPVQQKKHETADNAKSTEPQPLTEYDADPRVRTGAYYIIGVKTTVKVRAGQTLASISKAYLGAGMECYVEALNGVKEVKAGQTLKIPELRIKRK